MKRKGLLCAMLAGAVILACSTVFAEVNAAVTEPAPIYQTEDGVLSIEAPDYNWQIVNDPNYWFVISDGGNTITISHYSNGEALPSPVVAGNEAAAVYQAYVSTKNEVFVIKGSAIEQEDLETVMRAIGTIKVLKYDTKTAISTEAKADASQFGLREINETYYSTSDHLNVRIGCSTNDTSIGHLTAGEAVTVIGAVTKDGKDFGWYQIKYNGTTAYVSAEYLTKTAPGSETKTDSFTVYAKDGTAAEIHLREGAMYEDEKGRTYVKEEGDVYYCLTTDTYFSTDREKFYTGEDYGEVPDGITDDDYSGNQEMADEDETDGYYEIEVYAYDGSSAMIHLINGATYEDQNGRTYIEQEDDVYYCLANDTYYSTDREKFYTGRDYGENDDED